MKEKQNNIITRQVSPAQDTMRNIGESVSDTYDDNYRILYQPSDGNPRQECDGENGQDRQDNVNVLRKTESHISINRRNSISADRLTEKVSNLTNPHEIETEVGKVIEDITGGGEDLRRLFELLQEKREHFLVCQICEKRFELGNGGYLLLADWFRSLVKYGVGLLEQNEESAKRHAKSFPIQDWDEELFEAYTVFLLAKLHEHQDASELEEFSQKCIQEYPLDETGYYSLAKFWLYNKKRPEANDVLHEAIFEMQLPLDTGQKPVYIRCPQCCLLLLNEMEDNGCDPKWIVWTAQKAVEYVDSYDEYDIVYVLFRLADAMEQLKPRQMKKANEIYQKALEVLGEKRGEFGGRSDRKDYPRKDYRGILKRRLAPVGDNSGKYRKYI